MKEGRLAKSREWKNPMVGSAKMMLSPLLGQKGTEEAPDRVPVLHSEGRHVSALPQGMPVTHPTLSSESSSFGIRRNNVGKVGWTEPVGSPLLQLLTGL